VIQGIGKTWASTKICRLSNVRPVQLEQPRIGAIKGLQGSQCSSNVRSGTYGDPGKTATATDKIRVRPRTLTGDRRWALMEFADWTQPAWEDTATIHFLIDHDSTSGSTIGSTSLTTPRSTSTLGLVDNRDSRMPVLRAAADPEFRILPTTSSERSRLEELGCRDQLCRWLAKRHGDFHVGIMVVGMASEWWPSKEVDFGWWVWSRHVSNASCFI
jgi:hypothetical protein